MSISFVCHCHSEYSYIWPIYFDYIFENSKQFKKIVCVNNTNLIEDFFKTKSYKYDQLITYDETIPFNKRMVYIYNQINSDYVIFLGDNIVLTSINENKVISIVEWLKHNNYDSVQFHVKKNNLDSMLL